MVDDQGRVHLDPPDDGDADGQSSEVRITRVEPLGVPLERPAFVAPEKLAMLPGPPTDTTVSFLEEMAFRGAQAVRAVEIAWVWLPKLVSLIYMGLTMDYKGILKMLASVIIAVLAAKFGIGEGTQIAGFDLSEIIIIALAFIGGWVLPQLRTFVPQWLRQIVGWKDTPNG